MKIREILLFALMEEKCWICFFSLEECLGFAVISILFYTRQRKRDIGVAGHTTAQGYQLVSFQVLGEEAPAPKRCFAATNCSSAGASTSADDMEVTLSV